MNEVPTVIPPNKLAEVLTAFANICQPKTNYQIDHFVVGEHDTPERQYMQAVLQMQIASTNIRKGDIQRRRLEHEINGLQKLDTWQAALELEEKRIDLENLGFAQRGAVLEFNRYYLIFEKLPKFTYEQLQEAEDRYWQLRLARQSQCDIEANGRVGTGNHEALWQAGLVRNPGLVFLEENKERLKLNHELPITRT